MQCLTTARSQRQEACLMLGWEERVSLSVSWASSQASSDSPVSTASRGRNSSSFTVHMSLAAGESGPRAQCTRASPMVKCSSMSLTSLASSMKASSSSLRWGNLASPRQRLPTAVAARSRTLMADLLLLTSPSSLVTRPSLFPGSVSGPLSGRGSGPHLVNLD